MEPSAVDLFQREVAKKAPKWLTIKDAAKPQKGGKKRKAKAKGPNGLQTNDMEILPKEHVQYDTEQPLVPHT